MNEQRMLPEQYIVKTIRVSREMDNRRISAEIVYLRRVSDFLYTM